METEQPVAPEPGVAPVPEDSGLSKDPGQGEAELAEEAGEALTPEQAAVEAAALKALGNDAFKTHDYNEAVAKYSEALAALKGAEVEPDAVILANRAAAFIMLERFVPALRDAQLAGELRPDFWKAFWRQGVALMRLTPKKFRSRAAVTAFETCAKCSDLPDAKRVDVEAELAKARARLEQQEAETPMPEQCTPS